MLKVNEYSSPKTPISPLFKKSFDEEKCIIINSKYKYLIIILLSALLSSISETITFPALDEIRKALKLNNTQLDGLYSMYFLFGGIFPLYWGPLSDQYNKKIVWLSSLLIALIANFALIFVNSYNMLIFLTIFHVLGNTAPRIIGSGYLIRMFNKEEMDFVMGAYFIAPTVGSCLGPIFGGLTAQFHWRYTYLFSTLALTIMFFIVYYIFPNQDNKNIVKSFLLNDLYDEDYDLNYGSNSIKKDSLINHPIFKVITYPWKSIKLLTKPKIIMTSFVIAFATSSVKIVFATQTREMIKDYSFGTTLIGFSYFPIGIGCISACLLAKLYKNKSHAQKLIICGLSTLMLIIVLVLDDFLARNHFFILIPLILEMINGFFSSLISSFMIAYLMNLYPSKSGSLTGTCWFVKAIVSTIYSYSRTPVESLGFWLGIKSVVAFFQLPSIVLLFFILTLN